MSQEGLEQLPRLTHNLWYTWHQHVWATRQVLSAGRAELSSMVEHIMTSERTPLAERAGKALQLRLGARHLSRSAASSATVLAFAFNPGVWRCTDRVLQCSSLRSAVSWCRDVCSERALWLRLLRAISPGQHSHLVHFQCRHMSGCGEG